MFLFYCYLRSGLKGNFYYDSYLNFFIVLLSHRKVVNNLLVGVFFFVVEDVF